MTICHDCDQPAVVLADAHVPGMPPPEGLRAVEIVNGEIRHGNCVYARFCAAHMRRRDDDAKATGLTCDCGVWRNGKHRSMEIGGLVKTQKFPPRPAHPVQGRLF